MLFEVACVRKTPRAVPDDETATQGGSPYRQSGDALGRTTGRCRCPASRKSRELFSKEEQVMTVSWGSKRSARADRFLSQRLLVAGLLCLCWRVGNIPCAGASSAASSAASRREADRIQHLLTLRLAGGIPP